MSSGYPPPDYQYIAFIDEAGDPGIRKVRPRDPDGASEWLCMGGVVIDRGREAEIVEWVRQARNLIDLRQRPDLHFRRLSPTRKRIVCSHFAGQPLRCFLLASNKKNMRGHANPRAAKIPSQQPFYNWCIRLLLERVTDWCQRRSMQDHGEPRHVKLVFSERGGHAYSQTKAYLEYLKPQAAAGTTYLNKREIRPAVVDWRLVDALPHRSSAGLQMADIVASAFYQAADALGSPNWNPEYAKLLKPRMAREKGIIADYGVTLLPTPPRKARLTPEQQQIFRFYGYSGF